MTEVLYVKDIAERLGKSVDSVRGLVNRRSPNMPPPFKIGAMWAWNKDEVDEWLKSRPRMAQKKSASTGRPRGS